MGRPLDRRLGTPQASGGTPAGGPAVRPVSAVSKDLKTESLVRVRRRQRVLAVLQDLVDLDLVQIVFEFGYVEPDGVRYLPLPAAHYYLTLAALGLQFEEL